MSKDWAPFKELSTESYLHPLLLIAKRLPDGHLAEGEQYCIFSVVPVCLKMWAASCHMCHIQNELWRTSEVRREDDLCSEPGKHITPIWGIISVPLECLDLESRTVGIPYISSNQVEIKV